MCAGRLIRSDVPVGLDPEQRLALLRLGFRTAVDLRQPVERELNRADLDGLGIAIRRQPILGEDFHLANGMAMGELYRQILVERGANLAVAVRILAGPKATPALVFCSGGKDRTGLVTALVLGVLGVSDEDIVADYARSGRNVRGAFRVQFEARALASGIGEQELAVTVGAPPTLMRDLLGWLRAQYGGAVEYLREHGLSLAELELLRGSLVEPDAIART